VVRNQLDLVSAFAQVPTVIPILTLEVRIDRPVENTANPQLVHIQARRVPVVEDLGMTQPVDGRTVKGLVAPKTREEHLVQRPRVVEVSPGRFAGYSRKVGQR